MVIPLTSRFRNVTSGSDFSVGDLYSLIDDTYFDFVQFGWNYGYTDPAHGFEAVVHPFIGEYVGGPTVELLKFAFTITLTPGSAHTFELRRNEDSSSDDYGKWFGFIDGVARMKTTYAHWGGYVGTVGEVNRRCHGMQNANFEVSTGGAYLPTLEARRRSTGLWYTWAEHYNESNDACYLATRYTNGSTSVSSTALDYSTFASGCPQS